MISLSHYIPLSSGGLSGRLSGRVTVVSAVLEAMLSTGAELGRGRVVPPPPPPVGRLMYAVVVSTDVDLLFASSSWNCELDIDVFFTHASGRSSSARAFRADKNSDAAVE